MSGIIEWEEYHQSNKRAHGKEIDAAKQNKLNTNSINMIIILAYKPKIHTTSSTREIDNYENAHPLARMLRPATLPVFNVWLVAMFSNKKEVSQHRTYYDLHDQISISIVCFGIQVYNLLRLHNSCILQT